MNHQQPEVRYAYLRPRQVVKRRTETPIAYVPLGNVEWHGLQNPLGADTIQAEGAAIRAAQKGGGLVLPPLWYFAPLHEMTGWTKGSRKPICEAMKIPEELRIPPSSLEQIRTTNIRYQEQLVDILCFAESLGFKVCVLLAGHYPLIDHATIACEQFLTARKRSQEHAPMSAWACQEPTLRFLIEGNAGCGDHGGGWETSNCMALHPESVDLKELPARGEPDTGIGGRIDPRDADAERGRKNIEAYSDLIIKEAHSRLEHPQWYQNLPYATQVGKWRDDENAT